MRGPSNGRLRTCNDDVGVAVGQLGDEQTEGDNVGGGHVLSSGCTVRAGWRAPRLHEAIEQHVVDVGASQLVELQRHSISVGEELLKVVVEFVRHAVPLVHHAALLRRTNIHESASVGGVLGQGLELVEELSEAKVAAKLWRRCVRPKSGNK